MSDLVFGALFVMTGLFFAHRGWVVRGQAEQQSERMQTGSAARFQPSWAVRSWTPANMRARAHSMLVGGPAFVVFGVLLLTGVIHLG